jgi:hypothetical protein
LEGVDKQGADETVPSGVNDLDTIDTFGYQPGKAFDPGTGFWPNNQSRFSADSTQKNEDTTTIMVLNVAQKPSSNLTWKTIVGSIKTDNSRFFDNDLIGNLDCRRVPTITPAIRAVSRLDRNRATKQKQPVVGANVPRKTLRTKTMTSRSRRIQRHLGT